MGILKILQMLIEGISEAFELYFVDENSKNNYKRTYLRTKKY